MFLNAAELSPKLGAIVEEQFVDRGLALSNQRQYYVNYTQLGPSMQGYFLPGGQDFSSAAILSSSARPHQLQDRLNTVGVKPSRDKRSSPGQQHTRHCVNP